MHFQYFVAAVTQTLESMDHPIEKLLSRREAEMLLCDCFEAGWSPDETIDKVLSDARGDWLFNDFWRD